MISAYFRNAKHIPLAADFRTKLMYNNYMYAMAGYMSDLVKGSQPITLQVITSAFINIGIHYYFFRRKLGVHGARFV